MTRTDKELERAAEHAINFDPENARPIDLRGLREISEATEAIRAYEAKQREAVALARAHGISWNLIAGALGVSRQAARQRFSGAAPAITARGITVPKALIVSPSAVPKLSGRTGGRSARKAAKRKTGR